MTHTSQHVVDAKPKRCGKIALELLLNLRHHCLRKQDRTAIVTHPYAINAECVQQCTS